MNSGFTIDANAPQDFLFIGGPGTGKTSLALRFPSPYVMDCDKNLIPAVQYTGITNFKYDIALLEDDGKTMIPPELRYTKLCDRVKLAIADPSIKTIIIDSLTALCDFIISYVKKRNGLKDDATMRIQDWGDFEHALRTFLISLKVSGKHVIVIAHHKVEKDEADGAYKHFLNVQGKSQFTISGIFANAWTFFFDTEGVGPTAKTKLKVRTIPLNRNDHRGAKSGLSIMKAEMLVDDVIKELNQIAA